MQLRIIPINDIVIKSNRQRRDLDQTKILELAGSIAQNSLLQPIILRLADGEYTLVAGERRIKAIEHLHFLGQEVLCNDHIIPDGHIPFTFMGEIDPIDAEEAELEENIRREDLNWKERADAVARLANLRTRQADAVGTPPPSTAAIAEEVAGNSEGQNQENVRQDIILGRALQDPNVAAVISAATSRKEAFKLLKRHEQDLRNAALGAALGPITSQMFTLQKGDCLLLMQSLPDASFDVILSDPPYGIGADDFGDSGGRTAGSHFYDDSYETWSKLLQTCARDFFRLAKAQAHAYVFCDIDRFAELKRYFTEAGWKVFRTPLIWVNPGAVRAPWPEHGPQRKYQIILFAVKGDRPVNRLYGDVITCASDPNLGHPAQKPVAVISDLLGRSVRPGDSVLDPFAGSGTIFAAAFQQKCKATGIEKDEAAFAIAAKRIEELK